MAVIILAPEFYDESGFLRSAVGEPEPEKAHAVLATVRQKLLEIHLRDGRSCGHCRFPWPCPTVNVAASIRGGW